LRPAANSFYTGFKKRMYILLVLIHTLVCIFLIIVVLLQSGKAADLAGAFGGMGSQTAFGPRGSATLLSKATTASAVVFMLTSMALSIMATRAGGGTVGKTVLDQAPVSQTAPANKTAPAPVAPVAPVVPAPAGAPGQAAPQPSVTFTPDDGGPSRTVPLEIPKNLPPGQPVPVRPAAPAKK
jgi:preprotein translocase subunit SecG